jgi:DNA-binding response OmpR family regulator
VTPTPVNRVFIVDDESLIAFTLAAILGQKGFETFPYTDPFKALMEASVGPPDLLISDVAMPEMNGVDLAVHMKTAHPKTRVILFSGQASTADLLKSANADGHNFCLLTKPIHPTDLLAVVGRLATS